MRIVRLVLVIQGGVMAVALAWGWLRGIPWWEGLRINQNAWLGIPLGVALMASSTWLSWLARRWPWLDSGFIVDDILYPLFRNVGPAEILLAAAASGFAEEVLFRGVMQADIGIFWTSIVFGLLHTGHRRLLVLGPWSAAASLVLGWSYGWTGTLWCPVLAHFINNLSSMVYLRYFHRPADEPQDA